MKTMFITITLAAALAAANSPKTFTGVITDTMCGKSHGMTPGQPDDKCVAMCVKGTSSQYALYDGKFILKLSDQKMSAKYAAQVSAPQIKIALSIDDTSDCNTRSPF